LKKYSLHRNQQAYQIGKSTETALHNVVTRIKLLEHKDIAFGAFLDTDGAFDVLSFDTIKQAAERHSIEPAICSKICAMLEKRNIIATLLGENLGKFLAKGCPQGSVILPLLWSLVVDYLPWRLNSNGYYTVGYAVDIAILINGKFLQTVSEVSQRILCTVQQWCGRTKLSINQIRR
jgi:hypothetical protein